MLRSPMTMSASPLSSGCSRRGMSCAGVLIVGVGVDDEVGALLEGRVDARRERGGQPLVPAQPHDVIHAARARDVGRPVARPVVDDQRLDRRRCRVRQSGRSASVAGSVAASFRHGIWMISFFTGSGDYGRFRSGQRSFAEVPGSILRGSGGDQLLDHAVPGDARRPPRGRRRPSQRLAGAICGELVDRGRAVASGVGVADEAVDAVDDELGRAAGVGAGDRPACARGTPRASRSRSLRRRADRAPPARRRRARSAPRRPPPRET